ncbi:MAG: ribose-phosphate diphosphokinase [bacterium]|nr:ribose-phosphate diphosphokinase [bacterium]
MKNLVIYSTEDSIYFAELLGRALNVAPSKIERDVFGDGELYHRLDIKDSSELFGKTVIFVASTNSDKNFDELEKIGQALAEAGTGRRIFVIPFFGYSTMERAIMPGEMVSAKINARRLSNISGTDRGNVFLLLDLHVSGILHYFEGDSLRYELSAAELFSQAIDELKLKNFVFGTADLGRTKLVETFTNQYKTEIVFVRKTRDFKKSQVTNVIGDVKDKTIIIYDDMTRGGGTLIHAVKAYLDNGAKEVYAVLSHLALNNESIIKRLEKSSLKKIITTNSHPMSQNKLVKKSKKIIVKDISPEFVKIIKKLI